MSTFTNVLQDDEPPSKRPRSLSQTPRFRTNGRTSSSTSISSVNDNQPNRPVDIDEKYEPLSTASLATTKKQRAQEPQAPSYGIRQLSLHLPPRSRGRSKSRSPDVISIGSSEPEKLKNNATSRQHLGFSSPRSFHFPPPVEPIIFDPQIPSETDRQSLLAAFQRRPLDPGKVRKPAVQTPTRAVPSSRLKTPSEAKPAVQLSRSLQPTLPFEHKQVEISPGRAKPLITVPPHPTQQANIIRRIIEDVQYFKLNAEQIKDVTSVKPFEDDDPEDYKLYCAAAQKKHKKCKPKDDLLDFGPPSIAATLSDLIPSKDAYIINPQKQARTVLIERFKRPSEMPVTFENRRNTRQLNGKFQFLSDLVLSSKARKKALAPLPARKCHCVTCDIQCQCLTEIQSREENGETQTVKVQTYARRQDGKVGLSDEFLEKWTDAVRITECGDSCSCSRECANRVVQAGRKIPLTIFETRFCGFGVRSSEDIYKGQFIDVYLGEVLTMDELVKRENAAEEDTPSYILALDTFIKDEPSMLYIDGANFGSTMRFVNHSCEPNCTTLPVILPQDNKHIHHVGFFAKKDIPRGTELTIDYDPGLDEAEDDLDVEVVVCRCGSQNCRKRLWRPVKERRGRKRLLPKKDDD